MRSSARPMTMCLQAGRPGCGSSRALACAPGSALLPTLCGRVWLLASRFFRPDSTSRDQARPGPGALPAAQQSCTCGAPQQGPGLGHPSPGLCCSGALCAFGAAARCHAAHAPSWCKAAQDRAAGPCAPILLVHTLSQLQSSATKFGAVLPSLLLLTCLHRTKACVSECVH